MKKQLLSLFFLAAMLMSGIGLKAQEVTITLNPGCNWISYPNAVAMGISSALGDFVPMNGDTIKSHTANACYVNGIWRGNLDHFTPGEGYMYYSKRTDTTSFVFMEVPSPYVATAELTNITAGSAVVECMVTMPAGTYVYQRGVCWGTKPNPIIVEGNHTSKVNEIGIGISNGPFSDTLVGLDSDSTYYVRAYVISNRGTFYSNQGTCKSPIEVSTDTVTDILGNGATCWGTVFNNSGLNVIERGICWSKNNANPTLNDSHLIDSIGMDNVFSITITNDLRPNTTYYVRAYAITEQSIYYGDALSFTTMSGIPVVSTADVIDITVNSATCGGTVTDDGGLYVFERGICWSTSHNPTTSSSHANSGTGIGTFSVDMTGLTANTTYYVRAYATNSHTTAYGNEVSLTMHTITVTANPNNGGSVTGGGTYNHGQSCTVTATPNSGFTFTNWTENGSVVSSNANYTFTVNANRTLMANFITKPTVTTSQVTNITQTSATGGGNVTATGGADVTERGICYGTSHNPTTSGMHKPSGTGTGSFSSPMTDLTPGTTYYVRAYATNSAGTAYGNEVSFTTTAVIVPTVTTSQVTNITQTSATGGGNVTATGGANVTARGICWSTSHNPTTSGSHANNGTGTGTFSVSMTGLTANTTYYVRAYATNSAGTAYGSEVSFTTTGSNVPTGALSGKFTINSSGSKVYFSQGNLQYIGSASTPYWKFADHQWDCLGDNGQGSTSTTVDRDLFGWGTSGYTHGAVCYQPWSTNTSYSNYYAYGHSNYHLYNSNGKADWGYNKISNGGNTANSGWRTLTIDEWRYVLYLRNPSGPRFAKAKVNNVNGLILLPDDWNTSYYNLNNLNYPNASFSSNTITSTQWQTLEQHGAVFLPTAGYRYGTSFGNFGTYGHYWSSSFSNATKAYKIEFNQEHVERTTTYRSFGNSVRLVRPVQN